MSAITTSSTTTHGDPPAGAPVLGGTVRSGAARIAELDALRGLAAGIVVVHHVFKIFQAQVQAALPAWAYDVVDLVQAQNKRAVLVFFVLSGFAIAQATRGRPPVGGAALAHYASRRARRILPLYWLSLGWTAALGLAAGLSDPSFSLATLAGNLAFLQTSAIAKGAWFAPFGLNGPYWSLSYEAFFYLLLPFALLAVRTGPLAARPHTALIGFGILAVFAGFAANNLVPSPFSEFFAVWVVWLLGYVAAGLAPGAGSVALVAAPMLALFAANGALALAGTSSDMLAVVREGTVIGFLFALVALWPGWTGAAPVRLARRVFVALFERLGEGSYALYLLHYPLLLALHAALPLPAGGPLWWLSGVGLLLFALLFCPWLERTATRLARPGPQGRR